MCRTTEPGKFIVAFTGDVASVEDSYQHGIEVAGDTLIDQVLLPGAHTEFWNSLGADSFEDTNYEVSSESMLTVECFTLASTLASLDAGLKLAPSKVVHLQLGDDYGGKGYFILTGALEDIDAISEECASTAGERLISQRIIASPDPELPNAPGVAVTLHLPASKKK
jgi:microcompartment protein CcmL/EutN